jgi:hypothetical protein
VLRRETGDGVELILHLGPVDGAGLAAVAAAVDDLTPLDPDLVVRATGRDVLAVAAELRTLERRGRLEPMPPELVNAVGPCWQVPPDTSSATGDRTVDLLRLLSRAPGGALGPADIGRGLGLRSPTSRARWIARAVDAGWVEPTAASRFDPGSTYRLTDAGRRRLERAAG